MAHTTARNLTTACAVTSSMIEALTSYLNEPAVGANQLNLLLQLRIHGEVYQQDLVKFAGVERSAVSRNVAKLGIGERPTLRPGPGLVEAFPDIENRRLHIVRLTPKGRAVVDAAAAKAALFITPEDPI